MPSPDGNCHPQTESGQRPHGAARILRGSTLANRDLLNETLEEEAHIKKVVTGHTYKIVNSFRITYSHNRFGMMQ